MIDATAPAGVVAGVAVLHLLLGSGLGLLYFSAMWRSVRGLADAAPQRAAVLAGLLRFALLAAALVLVSREGAMPLLATAAGVMIGRFVILRRLKRELP